MDRRNREVRLKMAIIPETEFPGKIIAGNANYPYGQARDITTPSDGTGTPWRSSLVNDIFGFLQATLIEGGVTPSGTPDTAVASQYLTAIENIISAAISAAVPRGVRAWVRFGWNGSAVQIFASSGVTSVQRLELGKYRINFSVPIGDTNFAVTANAQQEGNTGTIFANTAVPMVYASTYVDVWTGNNNTDAFYDTANANVVIYK